MKIVSTQRECWELGGYGKATAGIYLGWYKRELTEQFCEWWI
jgi:hypothetical protein